MSKRITADELLQVGFVNRIFDCAKGEDEKFRELVFEEIENRLGDHLNGESLTKIKALIRKPERDLLDAQGVAEVFGGLDRFKKGIPQEEFRRIASGEKRHKTLIDPKLGGNKRVDKGIVQPQSPSTKIPTLPNSTMSYCTL